MKNNQKKIHYLLKSFKKNNYKILSNYLKTYNKK